VVILNLRDQDDLDSCILAMLTDYNQKLQKLNCRLMLAEMEVSAYQKLERTGNLSIIGSENVSQLVNIIKSR